MKTYTGGQKSYKLGLIFFKNKSLNYLFRLKQK